MIVRGPVALIPLIPLVPKKHRPSGNTFKAPRLSAQKLTLCAICLFSLASRIAYTNVPPAAKVMLTGAAGKNEKRRKTIFTSNPNHEHPSIMVVAPRATKVPCSNGSPAATKRKSQPNPPHAPVTPLHQMHEIHRLQEPQPPPSQKNPIYPVYPIYPEK